MDIKKKREQELKRAFSRFADDHLVGDPSAIKVRVRHYQDDNKITRSVVGVEFDLPSGPSKFIGEPTLRANGYL